MTNADRATRVWSRLEAFCGRTPEGGLVAYSLTEPLFCYERDTQGELLELVRGTLESYARTFYRAGNVTVRVTARPLERETDLIRHITPVERLELTIDDPAHDGPLATA